MEEHEIVKRFDEINDRLDELIELSKKSAKKVEATFQFIGGFKAHYDVEAVAAPKFGVATGDRVAYGNRLGTVVAVGQSQHGPHAVVKFDDAKPNERPSNVMTMGLTRLDQELAG